MYETTQSTRSWWHFLTLWSATQNGGLVTLISSTEHGTFNVFMKNRMPPGMVAFVTLQSSTIVRWNLKLRLKWNLEIWIHPKAAQSFRSRVANVVGSILDLCYMGALQEGARQLKQSIAPWTLESCAQKHLFGVTCSLNQTLEPWTKPNRLWHQ